MKVTAQQVINVMKGWIGMSRAKKTHKPIIDLYNRHRLTVIEGNMSGGVVGERTIPIGLGYIRGYACPRYADSPDDTKEESKSDTGTGGKYMFEVKTVRNGSTGNDVKLLQRLLKSNGCKKRMERT